VRLARDCFVNAKRHFDGATPTQFTTSQDRLFVMKSKKFQEMLNLEDFWRFYIARIKTGQEDLAETVAVYERDYLKTGVQFNTQ
jgi:hypothetical protein